MCHEFLVLFRSSVSSSVGSWVSPSADVLKEEEVLLSMLEGFPQLVRSFFPKIGPYMVSTLDPLVGFLCFCPVMWRVLVGRRVECSGSFGLYLLLHSLGTMWRVWASSRAEICPVKFLGPWMKLSHSWHGWFVCSEDDSSSPRIQDVQAPDLWSVLALKRIPCSLL